MDTLGGILVTIGTIGVPVALFLFARLFMLSNKMPTGTKSPYLGLAAASAVAPAILFLLHSRIWTALIVWAGIFMTVEMLRRTRKQL